MHLLALSTFVVVFVIAATKKEKPCGTFEYIDCYNDNIDIFDLNNVAIRDLNGDLIRTNNMTPEYCIRHCRDKGFKYAGLQAGYACSCGNTYGANGKANESFCQVTCTGDDTQTCGGLGKNAVYEIGPISEDPCKDAYKVQYLKLGSKYPNCTINVGECDSKFTCGERCDKPCVPKYRKKRQWCGRGDQVV